MNDYLATSKIRNLIIFTCISLYIGYSFFLSDYFVRLPSLIKEFLLFPILFAVFFDAKIYAHRLRITYPILVYISLIFIYSIIGVFNGAIDLFAIRYYFFPVVVYVFLRYYSSEYNLKLSLKFLFFVYIFLIIIGYIQIWNARDTFLQLIIQQIFWSNLKIYRLYLVFDIPNIAGGVLAALMLILYFTGTPRKYILLGVPVLFFVFSRAAVGAFIISIITFFFLKNKKNGIVLFVGGICFFFLVYQTFIFINKDQAFGERIQLAQGIVNSGINLFGKGIGFVTSSSLARNVVVFDNDFLRFIYEIGIFGLVAFFYMIYDIYKRNLSDEIKSFIIFFLVLMYLGDLHSMYPIPVIIYAGFALIGRRKLAKV